MTVKKKILIGAACVFTFWLVSQILFIFKVFSYPYDGAETEAVVVFTGGPARLKTALNLYDVTSAEKLFITSVGKSYLKKDDQITIDTLAKTTKENAVQTRKFVEKENIKKARLVTAAYHMPRAVAELTQAVPDLTIIPHPVYPDNFKKDGWYCSRKGLRFILVEHLKYRYVQIEYFLKGKK